MIPKIIHYCWYGGNEKPYLIRKCISSYSKLCADKVIEWNESNCQFNENQFIRDAFALKGWAFVSDYYRLKALYEYGGIYLDTDVRIEKPFDDKFYKADIVFGYMYDNALSTAVMMSTPHHPIIKKLLEWYESNSYNPSLPNNGVLTNFILDTYPEFKLNGKFCEFDKNCFLYPKEYFEVPTLRSFNRGGYSVHFFSQFWKQPSGIKKVIRPLVKRILFESNILNWAFNKYSRKKWLKNNPYYNRFLKDTHQ